MTATSKGPAAVTTVESSFGTDGAFFRPAADIAQQGKQVPRWVVEGLITPDLTLLYGDVGVGKSALAILLAAALASGEEYLAGWRVEASATYRVGVLVGDPGEALETARRLSAHDREAAREVLIASADTSRTDDPAYWTGLAQELRAKGSGTPVLFVDNAISVVRPGADLAGVDGALLVTRLAELASTGVAVVLVHHTTRTGKTPQGSRSFETMPSLLVALERVAGQAVSPTVNVRVAKSNRGPETTVPVNLQIVDGRPVLARR